MKRRLVLQGRVVHGDGEGRAIGYPTANLDDEYFRTNPQTRGVFASLTWVDGRSYDSVSVIGVPDRKHRAKIETHLFGRRLNLYGRTLTVDLLEKIRPLQWYATTAGLLGKIESDVRRAKKIIGQTRRDRERQAGALKTAVRELGVGMRHVRKIFRVGRSELAVRDDLKKIFHRRQAAFPFIVAFGPSGAFMHHVPTRRKLRNGDAVVIDLGIKVDGFCSDLTRTYHLGRPTPLFQKRYHEVLKAQRAGIAAVRPFISGQTVDRVVRGRLARAGLQAYFVHSTGHGLGRRIHQPPSLGPKSVDIVLPGDYVTVEPGIYQPGWGGIRIEDMVFVTSSGREVLTAHIPRELSDVVID